MMVVAVVVAVVAELVAGGRSSGTRPEEEEPELVAFPYSPSGPPIGRAARLNRADFVRIARHVEDMNGLAQSFSENFGLAERHVGEMRELARSFSENFHQAGEGN